MVSFTDWLAQLGLGDKAPQQERQLTDEDIEQALRSAKKINLFPPGVNPKE